MKAEVHFEWDEKKNRINHKKHGVWFEDAKQAFDDPLAIRYGATDPDDGFHLTNSIRRGWVRDGLDFGKRTSNWCEL